MSVSHHLVDPELLPGLEMLPSFEFSADILPQIREAMKGFGAAPPIENYAGVSTEKRLLRAPDGHDVPVLIHRPEGLPARAPVLVYAHGGGFVVGSAEMTRLANQRMAHEAECLIVSVEYRLPPEVPYPGPLEDCYCALAWVHENADELGIDPDRIGVAGESAGGGLVAALALLARDRGQVPLVHQHLIYPMLDDRTCRETANPLAGEFVWSPESNQFGWSSMLGGPTSGPDVPAYAAPARAGDLSGLPNTYIAVGALDLFAEEDMEYARRLMRAGVPTELHVYPGAYHGFELASEAQVTKTAHHNSITALRRALSVV